MKLDEGQNLFVVDVSKGVAGSASVYIKWFYEIEYSFRKKSHRLGTLRFQ